MTAALLGFLARQHLRQYAIHAHFPRNRLRRAFVVPRDHDHFQTERSFLISTHQVHDLQGLIDSVMVLAQGQILLHETVEALESRLQISVEQEAPLDALYVEKSLEGFKVIRENQGMQESRLDLELMFGLVTTGPGKVRELFREVRA